MGKSKNIGNRIEQHLFLRNTSSTYALKLSSKGFIQKERIRIKILKIDVKNYDQIVYHIEKQLRGKYNPIVGKQ